MDTSGWLGIIEFFIFSNMFKVILCLELGDHHVFMDTTWENGQNSHKAFYTPLSISINPPSVNHLYMSREKEVSINYMITEDGPINGETNSSIMKGENVSYVATITSEHPQIALPSGHNYGPTYNSTHHISLLLHPNQSNMFTVEAICVGRASLIIQITSILGQWTNYEFEEDSDSSSNILARFPYRVAVIRKLRLVDFIFDWVITAIAALNSLSIGCTSDWPSLRMHFRHPTSILLAACCQFIIMPTISLAIAKALGTTPELGLGLFYIACVPGGGLGHVMVSITGGDRALSVAINCVSNLAAIATAPLWIFAMSRFLAGPETDHKLYWFVVWLLMNVGCYSFGVFLRYVCPKGTEAYLNWFAKPFLLLYSILFITLGVYINMYMFSVLDHKVMAGAAILPLSGYLSGIFIAYISRQESEYVKTIAAETTMSNCLLVLVMERHSLTQPDSDITSALPMWILFTSPVPFLLNSIFKRIQNSVGDRCAKRREKKYRHFSIVSSLLNVTNVTTLSSSMSPKMLSPAEENCTSLIDEKITVL